MGINTKSKQDHKRNHVLERVGRNVIWRALCASKQHVGAEAASGNRSRNACVNVSEAIMTSSQFIIVYNIQNTFYQTIIVM
jgi:hypothetical protein